MTAVEINDAWMEECKIAISKIGGADVAFEGITETCDFDLGDKDIEGVPLVNGGRVTKWNPEGDSTVTFEAYPPSVGTVSGTTGKGFYDLMNSADSVVPVRIINDRNRDKYRVLFLWTNDSTATTAQAATTDTYSALRIGLAEGYFTSVKPTFTEGILKYTVMFKCAAFDKLGVGNVMQESAEGTGATDILPAIASYTTSYKFA